MVILARYLWNGRTTLKVEENLNYQPKCAKIAIFGPKKKRWGLNTSKIKMKESL